MLDNFSTTLHSQVARLANNLTVVITLRRVTKHREHGSWLQIHRFIFRRDGRQGQGAGGHTEAFRQHSENHQVSHQVTNNARQLSPRTQATSRCVTAQKCASEILEMRVYSTLCFTFQGDRTGSETSI